MASISLRNVTKRFGDTLAVDNVTLDIRDNAFFCLFGPPLSGKSTILKLILGLEQPDAGEILIDGQPVTHISPAKRNVAMVFQNLALFPHMTALENIRFPLVERRLDPGKVQARVDEVCDKLHIGHILHKPPAQLSGGERQRVAIARALVAQPKILFADEPTGNLDEKNASQVMDLLLELQKAFNTALVIVTHDPGLAKMADRTITIVDGQLV